MRHQKIISIIAATLCLTISLGVYIYRLGYQSAEKSNQAVNKFVTLSTSENEDPHHPVESAVRVRKGSKLFNDHTFQYKRVSRYKLNGNSTLFSVEKNGINSELESVMGLAVTSDSPAKLNKYLRPLFKCKESKIGGVDTVYFSSSANCGGGEVVGVKSDISVFTHMPDRTFLPMYICRFQNGGHYVTLNRLCEATTDRIEELVGYLKAEKVNIEI